MFAHLPARSLTRLESAMTEIHIQAGTVLMTEDEPAREAFIIVDGMAEVEVQGEVVAIASTGDLVGEIGLLSGGPRTATVTAVTPIRAKVMDPREFQQLFDHPVASQWIARALAQRLVEQHAQPVVSPA